jgi:hypothetical protein
MCLVPYCAVCSTLLCACDCFVPGDVLWCSPHVSKESHISLSRHHRDQRGRLTSLYPASHGASSLIVQIQVPAELTNDVSRSMGFLRLTVLAAICVGVLTSKAPKVSVVSSVVAGVLYSATMMMRRAPQAAGAARRAAAKAAPAKADKKPSLEVFVANGDFTGAVTLLEFERRAGEETPMTLPWLGYCAFHLGDYTKALKAYKVWHIVAFFE